MCPGSAINSSSNRATVRTSMPKDAFRLKFAGSQISTIDKVFEALLSLEVIGEKRKSKFKNNYSNEFMYDLWECGEFLESQMNDSIVSKQEQIVKPQQ
jgi:hypothetical protein